MVRLGAFGNRRPAQLSGGQQQRVALARALVFEPKLVLMDEPLGALDKQLREQMQYEIKHIHEHLGVTVVYVTHDQSEALTMSDRIAVFNDGVIQQLATPARALRAAGERLRRPVHRREQPAARQGRGGRRQELRGRGRRAAGSRRCPVNIGGPGSATTLSLRPERVRISPPPGECPNLFAARVEELIYLGDHIRTRVSVCGHDDFIVKVPNAGRPHPSAAGRCGDAWAGRRGLPGAGRVMSVCGRAGGLRPRP